ncbi:MAG: prenyltransferase/squalene oxidase repeat-containing protein [Pirellulales bacterium]
MAYPIPENEARDDCRPQTVVTEWVAEPDDSSRVAQTLSPDASGDLARSDGGSVCVAKRQEAIEDGQAEPGRDWPGFSPWFAAVLRAAPSWLVSTIVHMVALLAMGLYMLPVYRGEDLGQLVVTAGNGREEAVESLESEPLNLDPVRIEQAISSTAQVQVEVSKEVPTVSPVDDGAAAKVRVELNELGLDHAPASGSLSMIGAYSGDALAGRGEGMRGWLARTSGGSDGSERAVAAALKWLAEHQLADGGWSYDITRCRRCKDRCRNPGYMGDARNAATAMALLPFLGAGQTQKTGKYQQTVRAGLYFLTRRMHVAPTGGSLWEPGGRMYSHGLASIVLCEDYAMTRDRAMLGPAQLAVNFIVYAQDPNGGGWRYEPQQAGDTSMVGWQIMALKSAHMAYLRVPPETIRKAHLYLDFVQANEGANYGYTGPGEGSATTAIGLLCRMYLGWKADNPALGRGVQWLSDKGPSPDDMYYNYYATQVMRHFGSYDDALWKKWNAVMREQLVRSQATKGHEAGSWFFPGTDHGARPGGRLYHTALSAMILEVYYRHLPIYRKQSTEDNFPDK